MSTPPGSASRPRPERHGQFATRCCGPRVLQDQDQAAAPRAASGSDLVHLTDGAPRRSPRPRAIDWATFPRVVPRMVCRTTPSPRELQRRCVAGVAGPAAHAARAPATTGYGLAATSSRSNSRFAILVVLPAPRTDRAWHGTLRWSFPDGETCSSSFTIS